MNTYPRNVEHSVQLDYCLAVKAHIATGRAIFTVTLDSQVKSSKGTPDGRRQLVDIDERSVVTVIKDS
jgi:hypothetical protein